MTDVPRYDISVQTTIIHSDGSPFWTDLMSWAGVDDEVRVWLAGSCKKALFKLIGEPEVVEGESFTLQYRTIVLQHGVVVSDTSLVEFPKLSYLTVCDFEDWAMRELQEMLGLMIAKREGAGEKVKPRNRLTALARVVWQILRKGQS